MKKPIKLLFAAIAILVLSTGTIAAQETYDYAIVWQAMSSKKITISMNGKPLVERKVETNCFNDCSDLLSIIKELNKEGWELQSPSIVGTTFVYFLRKPSK